MAFRQELRVSSGVAPAHGAARAAGAHAPLSRTHLSSHAPIPAHEAWLLPLLLRRPRRRTPSTGLLASRGPFLCPLFFCWLVRDPRSSYGTPRTLHAAACNQADH